MKKLRIELTTTEIQWVINSLKSAIREHENDIEEAPNETIKNLCKLHLENKQSLLKMFQSKIGG